jgi:putative PIN family toxin of toxin-antitoxin system
LSTDEAAPELPIPVLVIDPNVFISAAISGRGSGVELLRAAAAGTAMIVVSPLLIDELRRVLLRPKFRRYLSEEEAREFVESVTFLARLVDDPPSAGLAQVTRDPKDDYLVFLAEEVRAALLVSGDRDLLELHRPGLIVRNPVDAVAALNYEHPWGKGLLPGEANEAFAQAEAEGHLGVLAAVSAFIQVATSRQARRLLPQIATPESVRAWRRSLGDIGRDLANRGMGNRPIYPMPNIALVKLPPDPGDNVRATGDLPLPVDTKILILQRRPELGGLPDLGGWRVHAIMDTMPSNEQLAEIRWPG